MKNSAPHPQTLLGRPLPKGVVNELARDGISTVGDLQLLTENELKSAIGEQRLREVTDFLSSFDGRLRNGDEPLHERARKVFEGTGTAFISVVHFYKILGKDKVHTLRLVGTKSAGALARLSREEIDERCNGYEPLSNREVRLLRDALEELGLESNAY